MISRHWKGIAKREQANDYIAHLKRDTFPKLASLEGFVQARILRRDVPSGTEFQVVSVWDSLQAIQAFAGAASWLSWVIVCARCVVVPPNPSLNRTPAGGLAPARRSPVSLLR